MANPKHCPGFERFRDLKSFTCRCHVCGTEIEFFTDKIDRVPFCSRCHNPIDITEAIIADKKEGAKNKPR